MKTEAQLTADTERYNAPGTGKNPFAWYQQISTGEKRAFWSCKIGYVLDAMDTQFLSFVIPTLIATWGITRGDAGLIGTVTLLSSALGGWAAGVLSDRIGRVKTLQITILWFAVFTLACALAQNFSQLLWARGLMGLGFGGEWTAGAVLIGEVIRPRDRGKAVGLVQAGWAIGWGVSTLLFMAVFSWVPADYAWRVLFAIGIAPAPFVIWIRRFVEEPEVHRKQKEAQAAAQTRPSLLRYFPRRYRLDDAARIHSRDRRARRLLRGDHVAADVSENRAASERSRHRQLSGRGDRRFVLRLSDGRLCQRQNRPQACVHRVRASLVCDRSDLYATAAR